MALTVHYIIRSNGGLILQARLVAFRHIEGSHTGENLAKYMIVILEQLEVLDKVCPIKLRILDTYLQN